MKKIFLIGFVLFFFFVFAACEEPADDNNNEINVEGEFRENIFVRVQGGTFLMGSPDVEGRHNERPQRSVTVSSFYMSRFPITQREWREVMGTNRSTFRGDNLPVETISWIEAARFANALSIREGRTPVYTITGFNNVTRNLTANGYRLPTEAEWEFAARGGIECNQNFTYSGSNIRSEVAWYFGNRQRAGTHGVGRLKPNALGLYDMSGNVQEWVNDWYGAYAAGSQTNPNGPGDAGGRSRVLRGGSWASSEDNIRVAARDNIYPIFLGGSIGFRLVRP